MQGKAVCWQYIREPVLDKTDILILYNLSNIFCGPALHSISSSSVKKISFYVDAFQIVVTAIPMPNRKKSLKVDQFQIVISFHDGRSQDLNIHLCRFLGSISTEMYVYAASFTHRFTLLFKKASVSCLIEDAEI